MNGLGDYSSSKGHIVIMGWRGSSTVRIMNQIFADSNRKSRPVIICSAQLETKPNKINSIKNIHFVKGNLASDDVIYRAGIVNADKILIHGRDDKETILTTLGVVASDDNDKAHITVYIEKHDNIKHIERMAHYHGKISTVVSVIPDMMVQEMQDPGVAKIVQRLVENNSDGTIYKVTSQQRHLGQQPYNTWQDYYKKEHGAIVFACETDTHEIIINPSNNPRVCAIYIINNERP